VAEKRPDDATDESRHRRGLTFRGRDDHAIELFREAQAHLSDIARVDRILLELSRFYNPMIDGPIVDLATRRRVVELLESRRRCASSTSASPSTRGSKARSNRSRSFSRARRPVTRAAS
jgi:hypothetical protein